MLYGLLLDRVSLSAKNRWVDEQGRVYIYYTLESIQADLLCANEKATKLLKELERYGLIERTVQGLCKPNRIYVKNFIRSRKTGLRNHENRTEIILILLRLSTAILILSLLETRTEWKRGRRTGNISWMHFPLIS